MRYYCLFFLAFAPAFHGCAPHEAELNRREVLEQRIYAKKMCACADRACATAIADEFARTRNPTKRKRLLNEEESAELQAESQRMTACYKRLLTPPEPPAPAERQRMFVVADKASICPTREEALGDGCGHTVEDPSKGYRRRRGETVTVTSRVATDGAYPAIRYMVAGELPGWVDARRVAPQPELGHVAAFRKSITADAKELDPHGPLAKGRVAYTRHTHERTSLASMPAESGEPRPTDPPVVLFQFPALSKGPPELVGLEIPECTATETGQRIEEFHDCLLNADCLETAWICDEQYCDAPSFLAESTDRQVEAPGWDGTPIAVPVLKLVGLADRFGTFRPCE